MGDGVVIIPQVQQTVTIGNNQQFSFTDTISATIGKSITKSENIADGESYQKSKSITDTRSTQTSTSTSRSTSTGTARTTGTSSQWQDSYGTTVATNFVRPGMKAGDVDCRGLFGGRPNATSGNIAHNYSFSAGGGSFKSFTTNEQTTVGSSETEGSGRAIGTTDGETIGNNRTVSSGTAETESDSKSTSEARGKVIGENKSISYAITYTTQILPNMKPAQIEDALANDNQLLIVRGKGEAGMLRIVERKAHYYEIPSIAHRVYGPPVINPPKVLGNLIPPKAIGYFPTVEIKINIPQMKKVEIIEPREGVIDPMDIPEKRFGIGKSGMQKYLEARSSHEGARNEEKKRKLVNKNERFMGVVRDIQSRSLALSADRDRQETTINNQWAVMDKAVEDVKPERVKLLEAKLRLEKKLGAIRSLEQTLREYQSSLLEDMDDECRYGEDVERYQRYIYYIHELRKGWKEFEVPERPKEIFATHDAGEWKADDLKKFISAIVAKFSKSIPDVPGVPVKPDRDVSPEYSFPFPMVDINSTKVELKSGVRVSLEELNGLLSNRKEAIRKMQASSDAHKFDYLAKASKEELAAARDNFIDLVEKETFRLLSNLPEEQKKYASWQRRDAWRLESYSGALQSFRMGMEQLAEQYIVLETSMDKHWEYLDRRFEQLNHANMILQARRYNLHNGMQKNVVWDGLEAQTKLLLENRANANSLTVSTDIIDPEPRLGSMEFDGTQNLHEIKRHRGPEPEIN